MSGKFIFSDRDNVRLIKSSRSSDDVPIYDISSKSTTFSMISPFSKSNITIPVPGNQNKRSTSVEGIWQGLKIIEGKIDESLFRSEEKIVKRKVEDYSETKFKYGNEEIGSITARKRINIPAYKYYIDNVLPKDYLENFLRISKAGVNQVFYDVDANDDISDATKPLSHASVLVKFLDEKLSYMRNQKEIMLNCIDKYTYRQYQTVVDTLIYDYENYFLPPSAPTYAANLHLVLNENVSLFEDQKNEAFKELSEAYANFFGYTFKQPDVENSCASRENFSKDWKFDKVRREMANQLYIIEK